MFTGSEVCVSFILYTALSLKLDLVSLGSTFFSTGISVRSEETMYFSSMLDLETVILYQVTKPDSNHMAYFVVLYK